jgi:acetyltransferase-like isoleucine patch superfamily enzyme
MNGENNIMKCTGRTLPRTKNAEKIAKLLKLSKIPVIGPKFLKEIPKLFTHAKNVSIAPGFFCINGNIDAEDVDLHDTFCLDYGLIKIGRHSGFSFQNMILTSTHDLDKFNEVIVKPVVIGENVW